MLSLVHGALQVLVYGDCAVNVEPSAEELALIAVTSAETAAAFGVTPRVAMLSYSTGVSGSGPQVAVNCCQCNLSLQACPLIICLPAPCLSHPVACAADMQCDTC